MLSASEDERDVLLSTAAYPDNLSLANVVFVEAVRRDLPALRRAARLIETKRRRAQGSGRVGVEIGEAGGRVED